MNEGREMQSSIHDCCSRGVSEVRRIDGDSILDIPFSFLCRVQGRLVVMMDARTDWFQISLINSN
jgi:hypothetical protein